MLHYINSTVEETVAANFQLVGALQNLPALEEHGRESVHELYLRERFLDEVKRKITWEMTAIYSRLIPAMFEHEQLDYLDESVKAECLFSFWAMRFNIEEIPVSAINMIFNACKELQDPKHKRVYDSARLSTHIAEIGTLAIASKSQKVLRTALQQYAALWRAFRERYPDRHFVGDFESAERELIEEQGTRSFLLDRHDIEFFRNVTPEQIHSFFAALE